MKLNEKKDIKPLFNYVILRIIDVNPYVIRQTASGIIIPMSGTAMSQETGQLEKLEQRIQFGVVVETGNDCRVLEVGDEVYFDVHAARPIPILDLGYLHLSEQNIMTYVRGEGDSIAEAREFEEFLREELKNGVSKQAATQEQKRIENSLKNKGFQI